MTTIFFNITSKANLFKVVLSLPSGQLLTTALCVPVQFKASHGRMIYYKSRTIRTSVSTSFYAFHGDTRCICVQTYGLLLGSAEKVTCYLFKREQSIFTMVYSKEIKRYGWKGSKKGEELIILLLYQQRIIIWAVAGMYILSFLILYLFDETYWLNIAFPRTQLPFCVATGHPSNSPSRLHLNSIGSHPQQKK